MDATTKPVKLTKPQNSLLQSLQAGPQIVSENSRSAIALAKLGFITMKAVGPEWEGRAKVTITKSGRYAGMTNEQVVDDLIGGILDWCIEREPGGRVPTIPVGIIDKERANVLARMTQSSDRSNDDIGILIMELTQAVSAASHDRAGSWEKEQETHALNQLRKAIESLSPGIQI